MKKINLLTLSIIFTIFSQGCSEDEINFESDMNSVEFTTKLKKGPPILIDAPKDLLCKIFVRYDTKDPKFHDEFLKYARTKLFSSIIVSKIGDDCERVDIWFVPCKEIPGGGRNSGTNLLDAEKSTSIEDEPGIWVFFPDLKSMKTVYTTCDQVPLLPEYLNY